MISMDWRTYVYNTFLIMRLIFTDVKDKPHIMRDKMNNVCANRGVLS